MEDFVFCFTQNLNKLAALVRGELPKLTRNILCALITIDVHARDIVTGMVAHQVGSLKIAFNQNCYKWFFKLHVVRYCGKTKMVYLNGRIQEIVSFIDSKVKTTVHSQPTLKNFIYVIECWSEYIDHAIEWLVLGLRESKFCLKCYKWSNRVVKDGFF